MMKKIISLIIITVLLLGLNASTWAQDSAEADQSSDTDYRNYLWELSEDMTDEEFNTLALRNYKFIQSLELLVDADSFQGLYKANVHLKQNKEGAREEFLEAQNNIVMTGSVAENVIFLWDKNNIPAPDGEIISEEELDAAPLDGAGFVPFLIKRLLDDPSQAKGNIIAISGGAGSNRSNAGEAYPAADVFNGLGYNVFVLQYRIAPYSWEDMYMDTQRAVRLVRYYAQEEDWGGKDCIAAVGWSAGAMCIAGTVNNLYGKLTSEKYDSDYVPDMIDEINSDMDAALLIYGGTIDPDCENPHIPALYLCVGSEDAIFSVEEIGSMYDMASERGIPALFHVIEGVGHGFGTGNEKLPEECSTWPQEADVFLTENRGYSQTEGIAAADEDTSIQVVCVGDSITAAGYPEVLGELLGEEYSVINCGQPGTQMMSGARFSYMDQDIYQESLDRAAQYYILMLGSNDSMSTAVWDPELFRSDYTTFLESYIQTGCSNIYVMIPPTVYKDENPRMLSSRVNLDVLNDEVCPTVEEIANEHGIPVVNLHTFTDGHPEWFGDGLHPNEEGNQAIAGYIYDIVFAQDAGRGMD